MIKFVYWSTTALLALGLLSGAYFNLTRAPQIVESMQALGYPLVVAGLLGFWKQQVRQHFPMKPAAAPSGRRKTAVA